MIHRHPQTAVFPYDESHNKSYSRITRRQQQQRRSIVGFLIALVYLTGVAWAESSSSATIHGGKIPPPPPPPLRPPLPSQPRVIPSSKGDGRGIDHDTATLPDNQNQNQSRLKPPPSPPRIESQQGKDFLLQTTAAATAGATATRPEATEPKNNAPRSVIPPPPPPPPPGQRKSSLQTTSLSTPNDSAQDEGKSLISSSLQESIVEANMPTMETQTGDIPQSKDTIRQHNSVDQSDDHPIDAEAKTTTEMVQIAKSQTTSDSESESIVVLSQPTVKVQLRRVDNGGRDTHLEGAQSSFSPPPPPTDFQLEPLPDVPDSKSEKSDEIFCEEDAARSTSVAADQEHQEEGVPTETRSDTTSDTRPQYGSPFQSSSQPLDTRLLKETQPILPSSSNTPVEPIQRQVQQDHRPYYGQQMQQQRPTPNHSVSGWQQPIPNQPNQHQSRQFNLPSNHQYRSSPNHYRGPQPSAPAQQAGVSSAWKSIWGKVEKGLDSLAKVEDVVAGRAQQLVSSYVPSSRRGPTPANSTPGKSLLQQKLQSRKKEASAINAPTTTKLAPYGNKYEVAKNQQQQSRTSSQGGLSRQVDWDGLTAEKKVIRANGGASAPNGQSPVPPRVQASGSVQASTASPTRPLQPQQYQQQQQQQGQGQTNAGGVQNVHPNTQSSQYTANPYLQSNNLQTPPKAPISVSDSHARASRIPWDSSAGSRPSDIAQKGPPQNARSDYETAEEKSFMSRLSKFMPPIPKIRLPGKLFRFGKKSSYEYASMDAWNSADDDDSGGGGFFGLFRRKSKDDFRHLTPVRSTVKSGEALAPPLTSMMARCNNGKRFSLLSGSDETRCRSIGRYQAVFDVLSISFILLGIQHLEGLGSIVIPKTLEDLTSTTLPLLGTIIQNSIHTWAPILFGYAYLAVMARRAVVNTRGAALANAVGSAVEEESQYSQLYLRLAAAIRMNLALPEKLSQAATTEVGSLIATSRLNTFVAMVLSSLVLMTVSFVGPVLKATATKILELVLLNEWRSWPIEWKSLSGSIQEVFRSLFLTVESLIARGLTGFLENPIQFVFHLSIFGSLLLTTLLPGIEKRRRVNLLTEEDDESTLSSGDSAQQVAKLGASSATRLSMLSENGSIEIALERWRASRVSTVDENPGLDIASGLRRLAYTILLAIVTALPIFVAALVGIPSGDGLSHLGLEWDSMLDVSIVLACLFFVANNAVSNAIASSPTRAVVKGFLTSLSTTLDEIRETNRHQADLQFMASISPTAGLVVKDLWAAHTTKRAWAVRGANLQCKNGQILAILGDDSAGKTRMLTTVAESLISPPRRSMTTNKVRGYVAIGGVEGSKWDKTALKRRLGVLLSDVRSMADTASLYSGWTMEEILEPVDGLQNSDPNQQLTSSERSSMLLAMKITGLYSTLIPRFPSKLSTVLTANEEDLRPSALGPGSQVLSPAEWSKLILAKVLAQTIYDNDNVAASTDKIEKCLVGSVLLLDEPTIFLSEVEETRILKELRQTGAATILTTNKWATGRFADQIVVVKDGAIVEGGTHNELIARGPQQSLYAAKWHAMTMQ